MELYEGERKNRVQNNLGKIKVKERVFGLYMCL